MKIANRTYPITIDAEDESALRTIEKEINGKIQFYKTEYESIDQLDAVTMTLLTYAHDLSKTGKPSSDPSQLSETLDHIDAMLSDAIS